MNAIENRFKVAVLLGGGFRVQTTLPEVDDYNFAPRDKIRTSLIDGKDDLSSRQIPPKSLSLAR